MRRAALLVLALALGCGAAPPPPVRPRPSPSAPVRVGDVELVVRERATDGRIATALFVRAPEESAALRAVAGWILETRLPALTSRATPDGLVLLARGESGDQRAMLDVLAAALATRAVTAEELAHALERLRAHRAGRAHDDRALAQRLAIESLVGERLDPLGDPSEDDAIDLAAIDAWLAASLGLERTLVVVVGATSEESAQADVAAALAEAPHVAAAAAPSAWQAGAARVAGGEHGFAAAATATPDLDEAARLAAWVPRLVPSARATAFPLRGRALVVASVAGDEDELAGLALALARARELDEEAPARASRSAEDETLAIGDAWLAQTTGAWDPRIALGLVRTEGPDDDGAERDDASLEAPAIPSAPRTIDGASGELTLASGLRVRAREVDGEEVAVVLAFGAGAALDPPREHGRTALLAAVLARSCEPSADDAWIGPDDFGVVLRAEQGHLERTLLRAVECVRHAREEIAHTEGVRASAIAALSEDDRRRAWAARVLAPGAPGRIAPRGSPAGIAAASELEAALDDALDARRAAIGIVAPAPVAHLLDVGQALGASLTAGRAPLEVPAPAAPASEDAFVTDPELARPEAIVALRATGRSEAGAAAAATTLAQALAAQGLAVRARAGGVSGDESYAYVVVSGEDAALDALPRTTALVLASAAVPASLADDAAELARTHALARADVGVLARALATAPPPDDDATAVAHALLAARPRFVMARPTTSPVRRPPTPR